LPKLFSHRQARAPDNIDELGDFGTHSIRGQTQTVANNIVRNYLLQFSAKLTKLTQVLNKAKSPEEKFREH
jgi:hypothetical protein